MAEPLLLHPDQFKRVVELFETALEADAAERAILLARADAATAAHVASLLEAAPAAGSFLDSAAVVAPLAAARPSADLHPGDRVGAYLIEGPLGRGGMGEVYRATQANPVREVAVKVLAVRAPSVTLLARFEREAVALARLQHRGIAQIIEAGRFDSRHGPRPYLVMELVRGEPIAAAAEARCMDRNGRLLLLAEVCDALEHAHQRGVIHRDLKPANILVDAEGRPKVLDFGIARFADEDMATLTADSSRVVGTLAYMSPEQVGSGTVDSRSDIYSLGVIAFEVLTGRSPYSRKPTSVFDAVNLICGSGPLRPSQIVPGLKGDLDLVLRTALAQDPRERYGSAGALGADLRRIVRREPISVRPPTAAYLLRSYARRNPAAVLAAAGAALLLVAGGAATGWQAWRAVRAEDRATARAASLRDLAGSLVDLTRSVQLSPGSVHARESILRRVLPTLDGLAADARTDDVTLEHVAGAYALMGRLLGHPYAGNLGRPAEAVQAYGRALELAPETVAALTRATWHYELGLTLGSMEDYAGADREFQHAAALSLTAAEAEKTLAPWTYLAEVYRVMVLMRREAGSPDAVSIARQAARSFAGLADRTLPDHDTAMEAAEAHVSVGMMLSSVGEHREAIDALERAHRAVAAALYHSPESIYARQVRGSVQRHIGRSNVQLGDLEGARDSILAALEDFRACDAAAPLRLDLLDAICLVLDELAEVHTLSGRHHAAMVAVEESLARREYLLAHNEDNQFVKRNAMFSYQAAAQFGLAAADDPEGSAASRRERLHAAKRYAARAHEIARAYAESGSPSDAGVLPRMEALHAEISDRVEREDWHGGVDAEGR